MVAVAFDTLKFAKRLKESGLTEVQAEVITEIQQETASVAFEQARHDYHLDDVASRRDLKELEVALKRDLKESEAALRRDLKELEVALKRDLQESEAALKRDLKESEMALKKDIDVLRADTKKDIAETKAELIRWVVGVGILQLTIITALLLKLAHQV